MSSVGARADAARERGSRSAALALALILLSSITCRDRSPTTPAAPDPHLQVTVAASRDTLRLIVEQTFQLSAMVFNPVAKALPNKQHTEWRSTRPDLATVDSSGLVTAIDTGRTLVIADHKKTADTVRVHVVPIPVAKVVVTPASLSLEVGEPATLTAATLDSLDRPLAGRVIAWGSSAPEVATVSPSGEVTGIAPGTATVSATSEGKIGTASLTVLVPWVVSPTALTVRVGESLPVRALRGDAALDGVEWSTSDPAIAAVSDAGIVTGAAEGTATISARYGWKGSAPRTIAITVIEPVASVEIQPWFLDMWELGWTWQYRAVLRDRLGRELTGREVTWTSSDASVASVSPTGLVTGLKVGDITITAASEGKSATGTLLVHNWVWTLRLTPDTLRLPLWEPDVPVIATLRSYSGHPILGQTDEWKWLDPAPATLLVRGDTAFVRPDLSPPTLPKSARLMARSHSASDTMVVTITPPLVKSVRVSGFYGQLRVGNGCTYEDSFAKYEATAYGLGGAMPDRHVSSWRVSNNRIAIMPRSWPDTSRIRDTVTIRGGSAGYDTLTATIDGVTGSAVVQIYQCVHRTTISPATSSVPTGGSAQLAATITTSVFGTITVPPNTYSAWASWSSSNPAVATVDVNGVVRGVSPGTAIISAAGIVPDAGGSIGQATVTVYQPIATRVEVSGPDSLAVANTGCNQWASRGTYTAFGYDQNNLPISLPRPTSWSVAPDGYAQLSETGTGFYTGLTALEIGVVTLTATQDGVQGSRTVRMYRCAMP